MNAIGLLKADVETTRLELIELLHRGTRERDLDLYACFLKQLFFLRHVKRPGIDAFGDERKPHGLGVLVVVIDWPPGCVVKCYVALDQLSTIFRHWFMTGSMTGIAAACRA